MAIGISRSRNTTNVLEAQKAAREADISSIVLTGGAGGEAAKLVEVALMAPSRIVWHFQECHSTLIHVICGAVVEMLAGSLDE
jgi:phosphoheptose isomerase